MDQAILLKLVSVTTTIVLLLGSIGFGYYLPIRLFGQRFSGFVGAVVIGSFGTPLVAMMLAYVLASWGEELFGAELGVAAGLVLGGFFGAFLANVLLGLLGAICHRPVRSLIDGSRRNWQLKSVK